MQIEQYLTDEQDPKTAEKVLGKLRDMLTSGEAIVYLAIQKTSSYLESEFHRCYQQTHRVLSP